MKNLLTYIIIGILSYTALNISDDNTPIPDKPQPPKFHFEELKKILELSTISQRVTIEIDTILPVKKEYHNLILEFFGINRKIWTSNTTARIKQKFVFLIKAGCKLQTVSVNGNTINVEISKPFFTGIETIAIVSTTPKHTNNQLFINKKYLTVEQQNSLHDKAKQLVKNKAIDNGIFIESSKESKTNIHSFLSKINTSYNLKINEL